MSKELIERLRNIGAEVASASETIRLRRAAADALDAAEAENVRLREAANSLLRHIQFKTEEFGAHTAELVKNVDDLNWSVAAWRLRRAVLSNKETTDG